MNELGEGDIDIIKQPIVIDNVSIIEFTLGKLMAHCYFEYRVRAR